MTKKEYETQVAKSLELYEKAGIVLTDAEKNSVEVVDFGQGEQLIPAAEEFFAQIDFEKRHIKMVLPEGLLEI